MDTTADKLQSVLTTIVQELVDQPDGVSIQQMVSEGGNTAVFTVHTANEAGKVIGRHGKNAQALRTILEAIAAKYRQRVVLEIAGYEEQERRPDDAKRVRRRRHA